MHKMRTLVLSRRCSFATPSLWEFITQRRYKYKPKWAMHKKPSTDTQRALDHFDAFYRPVFREQWPLIRLSLLSLPKHCAVVNKFSDISKVEARLEYMNTLNILEQIRNNHAVVGSGNKIDIRHGHNTDIRLPGLNLEKEGIDYDQEEVKEKKKGPSELSFVLEGENIEEYDEDLYRDNLNVFVPPEQVVTEKERMLEEEVEMNTFHVRDGHIETVPMEAYSLPTEINAFIFSSGDVTRFPQSKVYNQTAAYYLMDAASLLPVLALNLNPFDKVLDLCAAPGGKSFLMSQKLDLENGGLLHCNDESQSRLTRLKNVLHSYIPPRIAQNVTVTKRDGLTFTTPMFDKVLVDVPCNTDRHVVTQEENNLFKISRSRERLSLMREQKDLLVSAIKSCVVGGSVVYSTCTLALAQNDGVIQAAVEHLRERTQIDVVVEDMTPLANAFNNTFTFFDQCRYGQLVLPTLTQNFGPLYFAKLKRVR